MSAFNRRHCSVQTCDITFPVNPETVTSSKNGARAEHAFASNTDGLPTAQCSHFSMGTGVRRYDEPSAVTMGRDFETVTPLKNGAHAEHAFASSADGSPAAWCSHLSTGTGVRRYDEAGAVTMARDFETVTPLKNGAHAEHAFASSADGSPAAWCSYLSMGTGVRRYDEAGGKADRSVIIKPSPHA